VLSALILLFGHQEQHLVCDALLASLSVWSKVQMIALGPADAAATLSSHVSLKSGIVNLSGAGLPRLSWESVLITYA